MKTPQEVFSDYLSRQNLKMTPQRRIILETFLESQGHLSSEELYELVKANNPNIGQATVYRTIKLLSDSGIAVTVDFSDGVARYELEYGQAHHDHIICEICRKNIEIVDEEIERRQEELAAQHGFVLSHHSMYLYGICEDCRKKRNK